MKTVFIGQERHARFAYAVWGIALVAAVALSACGPKSENKTAGQKLDAAIERTEETASATGQKASEIGQAARDKTNELLDSPKVQQDIAAAKETAKDAGSAIKAGTADAAITATVKAGLARDSQLSALKIDVDTNAGAVRLQGPAPSLEAKTRATDIAKAVSGVSSVDNQLMVGAPAN